MNDPLRPVRILKEIIKEKLKPHGLELDDNYFHLEIYSDEDNISFRVNILPEAVIKDEDFDQIKYDQAFKEIVEW